MEEIGIREDIINALNKAVLAIEEQNTYMLKELSNRTIHNATLFQDWKSINTAVVIYALSKISERKNGNIPPSVIIWLKKAIESAKNRKDNNLKRNFNNLLKSISKTDNMLKWYINHVIEQAQIKKGSRIYEHGISLARTAELMKITLWDLMSYTGNTNIAEKYSSEINIKERINFARKVFN